MELAKAYDAKSVQDEIGAQWDAKKLWHAEPDGRANRYSIVIPPPNVTGALHLGHAINNTLQDILIRVHRMRGDNTVWLPGTDHAGIATQTVVDKRLQAAGEPALKEYKKIEADGGNGREQFIEKVNAWKTEYEARILGQLKAMGCSCDWDRVAFTMDEPRSKAVREAFFQLFKAGLIYRGKRLVNWDPVTQTALADDEVEMEEVDGHFYYLKYPVVDLRAASVSERSATPTEGEDDSPTVAARYVTVATTRPETMLGDAAVAINPKDPRAAALRGKFVKLPIVDRLIPIIEDEYVVLPIEHGGDPHDAKAKFSSGFLKVTPAHDPNDYVLGEKYKLDKINVMAPDASISLDHGWGAQEPAQKENATLKPFVGLARESARAGIVDWFKTHGLLEKVIPYRHSVGHSYRSHAAIEPYLSDQWYCKVTDNRLAGAANAALAADHRSDFAPRNMSVPLIPSGSNASKAKNERDAHVTNRDDDGLRFFPERYAKTYESWNANIRDWCISRQLWWGHRIPVWSKRIQLPRDWKEIAGSASPRGAMIVTNATSGEVIIDMRNFSGDVLAHSCLLDDPTDIHFGSRSAPSIESLGWKRDPDVLDTWFSSALWPLSTLGWPNSERAASVSERSSTDEVDRSLTVAARYWNPTSVLCTGRDIITLWVSRMVMFNLFLTSPDREGGIALPDGRGSSDASGRLPFRHVYINPTIQDGQGQRMSKSLGNGVDPLDVISTHGADAMRFTLARMATQTQDVKLPVDLIDPHTGETFEPTFITNSAGYSVAAPVQEYKGKKCVSSYGLASGAATPTDAMPLAKNTSSKFDLGRNFCNKLWNAGRFVLVQVRSQESGVGSPNATPDSRLPTPDSDESKWSTIDRWILSRLARTIQTCNTSIDSYRFDLYAEACYDFVWRDFCDWYLEASKPAMKDAARRASTARILATCFDVALRLMHPMIPFITEKLWAALNETGAPRGIDDRFPCDATSSHTSTYIMTAPYLAFTDRTDTLTSEGAERVVTRLQEIVGAIRQVRNDNKVDLKKRVPVTIQCASEVEHHLAANREFIEGLALCTLEAVGPNAAEPAGAAKTTAAGVTIHVSGVVDAGATEKRKAELGKMIAGMRTKLSNEGYVAKAPPKVVEETRAMLVAAEAELAKLG